MVARLRDPETYAVIGAAMEVHRVLGTGFLEAVYHDALTVELRSLGIPHRREVRLPITYKGTLLAPRYQVDFVCYDALLVELKAVENLGSIHEAQLLNYLKASAAAKAILLNFGTRHLQYRRFIGPSATR